jgi:hypothetical protein
MRRNTWSVVVVLVSAAVLVLGVQGAARAEDKVLFDFEDAAALKDWSALALDEKSKLPGAHEPAAKWELSTEGATSGKQALKITFDGGKWPTLTTTAVPLAENWVAQKFQTFKADVTVTRPCLVGFRVLMEDRKRDNGYPWALTVICKPGKNEFCATLGGWWTGMEPKDGQVTGLDIFMYNPHKGESILVDNIRLGTDRPAAAPKPVEFKVLGTDLTVTGVADLLKKLKNQWKPPVEKPIDEVEAEFRAQLDELKKTHPKAVLAIFRDGEKGWDPANPDKAYEGWMMRHINSHGPDSAIEGRASNSKGWGWLECFMRHRSLILQADFSSIPKGSEILASRLILTRNGPVDPAKSGCFKANMWVAEPCNRPWVETEVNAYQYANDKFWKTVGAMYPESYEGDDPDFWPVYIAHGPSTGVVNVWDFTDAMKFWLDGKHVNHGFFIHGDSTDLIGTVTCEAKEIKQRPTIMVVYEPK